MELIILKKETYERHHLVSSLVEIGALVLETKAMQFHLFVIISLRKTTRPFFEQISVPFNQGFFFPSLVEIEPDFSFRQCIFALS